MLAPRGVIGEVALFTHDFRGATATVVAESDLLMMQIDVDKFWEMVSRHFAFGVTIEKVGLAATCA